MVQTFCKRSRRSGSQRRARAGSCCWGPGAARRPCLETAARSREQLRSRGRRRCGDCPCRTVGTTRDRSGGAAAFMLERSCAALRFSAVGRTRESRRAAVDLTIEIVAEQAPGGRLPGRQGSRQSRRIRIARAIVARYATVSRQLQGCVRSCRMAQSPRQELRSRRVGRRLSERYAIGVARLLVTRPGSPRVHGSILAIESGGVTLGSLRG